MVILVVVYDISINNNKLISVSSDSTVKIWNIFDGNNIINNNNKAHTNSIFDICVSNNKKYIISCSEYGNKINIFNFSNNGLSLIIFNTKSKKCSKDLYIK